MPSPLEDLGRRGGSGALGALGGSIGGGGLDPSGRAREEAMREAMRRAAAGGQPPPGGITATVPSITPSGPPRGSFIRDQQGYAGQLAAGDFASQGRDALARAVADQRQAAASLGRSSGGLLAERMASQGIANTESAGMRGQQAIAAGDQQARQALLGQMLGNLYGQRVGERGIDTSRQIADLGGQTQRDLIGLNLLSQGVGGAVAGGLGAASRAWGGSGAIPNRPDIGMPATQGADGQWYATSDERAKRGTDEPVALRPGDALGAVLAMVGRLDERVRQMEGGE